MILNKASHERGFAHATVYKSEVRISVLSFVIQLLIFDILVN